MAKKIKEQGGMVADIPLRSTTKVYYVRMENGMPSGDEGWVTVDEAKRMNAADRRMHGQPMNRYFQDQQSAEQFVSNPPTGAPPSEMPAPEGEPMGAEPGVEDELGTDQFGDMVPGPGEEEPGMEGMSAEPMFDEETMDAGIGEFGDGIEDEMGLGDELGEPDLLGGEEDLLGGEDDLLGDLDVEEEEAEFELVVPRRVRLVPARESLGEADLCGYSNKLGVMPDDVDKKQLKMGIDVELEHTEDRDVATQIALDHLAEIPDYYTRLAELEKDAKSDGKFTEVESVKSFADLMEAFKGGPFGVWEPEAHEEPDNAKTRRARRQGKTNSPEWRKAHGLPPLKKDKKESDEPEPTNEAAKCKYCGAGVQGGICSACRRLQGDLPKAEYRDEPHNGVKKDVKRRESVNEQTDPMMQAGIFEPGAFSSGSRPKVRPKHKRPPARRNRLADPEAGTGPRRTGAPTDPMLRGGAWTRPRVESKSTEAGIIEALISGDCTPEQAVEEILQEQSLGSPMGATWNPQQQAVGRHQVKHFTQGIKTPRIAWGQQQQQPQEQIPPDIQPLYDQYLQALQSGDQTTANRLKQQLVFDLQVAGIDPTSVGIR